MTFRAAPPRRRPALPLLLLAACIGAVPSIAAGEDRWEPLGPEGGDMAALVEAPGGRLYAVTAGRALFASDDLDAGWERRGTLPDSPGWLLPDPFVPDRLYLFGIPWRSDDGGATWHAAGDSENPGSLVGVVAFAVDGATVLLDLRDRDSEPDLLRRSTDGGATWETVGSGLPEEGSPRGLAVSDGPPLTVWVTAAEGLFRSLDGGSSFVRVAGLPVGPMSAMAVAASDPRYLYVGFGDGRIARSFDGGAAWGPISRLPGDPQVVALSVDPHDRSIVTAATSGARWISTDAAVSWRRVEIDGEALTASALLFPAAAPGLLLAALPTYAAPPLPGGAVGGVVASLDAGTTWEPASHGLTAAPVDRVAVAPGPSLLVATPSGLLAGRPGGGGAADSLSWGPPEFQLPEVAESPFRTFPAVTATVPAAWPEHLFVDVTLASSESRDGGATWTVRSDGIGCQGRGMPTVAPSDPDSGFLWGGFVHRICQKEDACVLFHWRGADLVCVAGTPRPNAVSALAIDARDADRAWLVTSEEGGLYGTVDGGAHWQRLPDPPFVPTALAAHPLTAGRLLAGSVYGGIWRSDDGGASWRRLRADDPPTVAQRIEEILIDPVEPTRFVARLGGRVVASDDDGRTWAALDAGLPAEAFVFDLALDPASPSTLYAAVAEGGTWRLERTRAPAPCVANRRNLCLGDGGRYRVVLSGRDGEGWARIGQAVRLDPGEAPHLGGFGIGPPPLLDALVEVVGREDGAADVLWLALSANPFTVVVTDTVTGRSRGFRHPAGGAASGGDPEAFPPAP